jgi:hypothetical protein
MRVKCTDAYQSVVPSVARRQRGPTLEVAVQEFDLSPVIDALRSAWPVRFVVRFGWNLVRFYVKYGRS